MQDNFTGDTAEKLIQYIDDELSATEKEAVENLLRKDASAQEHYQHFLAAKQAIKAQGLKERVKNIQQEYLQEINPGKKIPAAIIKRKSYFKTFISIAAIFLLAVAGYGVFQYTSTTNQSVYDDNFISYQLPVNRSSEKSNKLDSLYQAGKYSSVVNAVSETPQKNQKDYFLAAQSYLQLNNAFAAIDAFQQVENLNYKSSEKYFVQETDYYLMLAYIKGGKIDLAEKQLEKIRSNKQHLFYSKAGNISRTKLLLLKWKK